MNDSFLCLRSINERGVLGKKEYINVNYICRIEEYNHVDLKVYLADGSMFCASCIDNPSEYAYLSRIIKQVVN